MHSYKIFGTTECLIQKQKAFIMKEKSSLKDKVKNESRSLRTWLTEDVFLKLSGEQAPIQNLNTEINIKKVYFGRVEGGWRGVGVNARKP